MHRRAMRRSSPWTMGTSRSRAAWSPARHARRSLVTSGVSGGIAAILRRNRRVFSRCEFSRAVPAFSGNERWALATEGGAMRKLIAAWAVGLAATGGSVASAQNPENALTITLHVADYAAISPRDLAAAEAYATAIYAAAGIQTVWTDAPWVHGEPRSPHLRVVILTHEMTAKKCRESRLGRSVMGVAVEGAPEGGGRIAYVFADRIGQT